MAEVETTLTITNANGLHARPARLFVETCNRFTCDVLIIRDGQEVNGKSIMGIMMLGAECGAELTIRTNGPDAQEAADALTSLVEDKFGEDE
jgi:phosphocarrier protein